MSNAPSLMGGSLALASALVIGLSQPVLSSRCEAVRVTSDVYSLPEPDQMPVMSLGYRAAVADVLWAYVLVTQGLRLQQHRKFDYCTRYFETIFALEPTYREPYLYADSLLSSTIAMSEEDVRALRALYEKGMVERPTDAKLYYIAGSFMAYVAPSVLPESEHANWRLAGANALRRAAELGATAETQWSVITSASLLTASGERAAAISLLERVYQITDDDDLRERIRGKLLSLREAQAAERAQATARAFETAWRADLPFVKRPLFLVLGPKTDPVKCAGPENYGSRDCVRDWVSWSELQSTVR